jgi:spore coat protein SA
MELKPIICLLSPGRLPVPAVKGGAVETLIEILAEENELSKKVILMIFSTYNYDAEKIAKKYKYSKFYFIKTDSLFEKFIYLVIRILSKLVRVIFNDIGYIYSSYYAKCFKTIRQEDPQFIVAEGGDFYLLKYLLRFFHRNRLYLHLHGRVKPSPTVVNIFGNVIGVSGFITGEYMKQVKNIDVKEYTVINCCNDDIFRKRISPLENSELKKTLGFNTADFIVLFCGRINKEKGVKELIKAITNLNENTIKLLIIGSVNFGVKKNTPYLHEIENLVSQSKGRVIFTGYIKNEILYKYHQIADMMVVPSLWEEPCALTVLEGLTSGLPLLVTNSGGTPELVTPESSIIVERDEHLIDNLASNIMFLYGDEKMRVSMSMAAEKDAQRFSRKRYYLDFISVFQEN